MEAGQIKLFGSQAEFDKVPVLTPKTKEVRPGTYYRYRATFATQTGCEWRLCRVVEDMSDNNNDQSFYTVEEWGYVILAP